MRVRYTKRAFADREAIFDYISQQDSGAAARSRPSSRGRSRV
jgi:plasmid stabilization system protein ParE